MAFLCRKAKKLTGSLVSRQRNYATLAAALFLCGAAGPLYAQSLNPVNTGASLTTLSFGWNAGGSPFIIALSTAADFSVTSASGPLAAAVTTYVNLDQNELYYFRVKRAIDADTAYAANQLSSATYAAAPTGIYFESANFASDSAYSAQIGIGWLVAGNPEWTGYPLEYSKDPGLAGAAVFQEPYPPVSLGGLDANTTYYLRVRAANLLNVPSAPTGISSTATLALALSSLDGS